VARYRRQSSLPFRDDRGRRGTRGLGMYGEDPYEHLAPPAPYTLHGPRPKARARGTYPGTLGRTRARALAALGVHDDDDVARPRSTRYDDEPPRRPAQRKLGATKKRRTRKKPNGKIKCKMQTMKAPSGKTVRRKVCRNSLGQIVSNPKKKSSRKRPTKRRRK
jgi:hypothetical protein